MKKRDGSDEQKGSAGGERSGRAKKITFQKKRQIVTQGQSSLKGPSLRPEPDRKPRQAPLGMCSRTPRLSLLHHPRPSCLKFPRKLDREDTREQRSERVRRKRSVQKNSASSMQLVTETGVAAACERNPAPPAEIGSVTISRREPWGLPFSYTRTAQCAALVKAPGCERWRREGLVMQVTESLGGPYILIDGRSAPNWLGADGRRFFDKGTGATDYEILEQFLELRTNVMRIEGEKSSAMLIVPPFELALIESGKNYALIAQVHYADAEWSFSAVEPSDFDAAVFDEHLSFHSQDSAYLLFDAAYLANETEKARIEFALGSGDYVLAAANYQPDESTFLTLYRVQKAR